MADGTSIDWMWGSQRIFAYTFELYPTSASGGGFYPPGDESSFDFVNRCQSWGFLIGGQSGYLMEQRLVQVANMGTICQADLERLFNSMERWLKRRR